MLVWLRCVLPECAGGVREQCRVREVLLGRVRRFGDGDAHTTEPAVVVQPLVQLAIPAFPRPKACVRGLGTGVAVAPRMDNAKDDLGFSLDCLRVEAKTLHFRVGRAEPIVLLHPFSLCPEVWKPIIPELEKHHPVYALGLPGHLGTDPLPNDFDHSIEGAVDLLEAKLDELGIERAHVVGNSLGGWLAIELARRGRALSVVAISPGGGWEAGSPEDERLMRKFKLTNFLLRVGGPLSMLLANFAFTRKMFLSDAVARPECLQPEDAALFIDAAWRCTAYTGIVEALPRQPEPSAFEMLPCRMRVIWGSEDRVLPIEGYSERWKRLLNGADWLVLEDVGHVPMYDNPQAIAESILEWTSLRSSVPPRLAS